jgi:hypothetical protein
MHRSTETTVCGERAYLESRVSDLETIICELLAKNERLRCALQPAEPASINQAHQEVEPKGAERTNIPSERIQNTHAFFLGIDR